MSKAEIIVLVGLPGAGKTEYANTLAADGYVVCSSDEIRKKTFGDINDQEHNSQVFQILHKEIREHLLRGEKVIYDACNINSKRRRHFLNFIKDIDCLKAAHVIAPSINVAIMRNTWREKRVPSEVLERMYKNWQTPAQWEGYDNIELISMVPGQEYDISKFDHYNQNNPHHQYSLGEHMRKTAEYIKERTDDYILYEAALRHDAGKPYCEFKDEKGVSHYYGHAGVAAYDVLSEWEFDDNDALEISQLITYHMYPLFWEKNDASTKYRKIWGEEFFNKIMLLSEADRASHGEREEGTA